MHPISINRNEEGPGYHHVGGTLFANALCSKEELISNFGVEGGEWEKKNCHWGVQMGVGEKSHHGVEELKGAFACVGNQRHQQHWVTAGKKEGGEKGGGRGVTKILF